MKTRLNLTRVSLAVGLANAILSGGAVANDLILDEIVVTAQKREQSIQDVPISVSAVSGEKIEDAGINNLEGLSSYVPNLNISEGGQTTNIFMRGLGSGVNFGFEQSVGMYIDGVYYGRERQYRSPFLDLDRVEVLRGPQGTLFGKNTIAGAINITTAKPTEELEANLSAEYEPEYDSKTLTGVLSGAITDSISARLALKDRSTDGFLDNTLLDQTEPAEDESVARLTVSFAVTDDLEITAKLEHSEYEVTGRNLQITSAAANLVPVYTSLDPEFDGELSDKTSTQQEFSSTDSDNFVLTANYLMGDFTITSITGYSAYDGVDQQDVDFTPLNFLNQSIEQDFEQVSQELRITSPLGETFDYIAGIYFQTNELSHLRRTDSDVSTIGIQGIPATRLITFDQDSDSYALFAQGTYHITPTLHLTGGIRYTREEKTATQIVGFATPGTNTLLAANSPLLIPSQQIWQALAGTVAHSLVDVTREESDVSPMLNLQWDVTDDIMLYGSVSRGFKGGGFNEADDIGNHVANSNFNPNLADTFEYDEETATSFEFGGKATLLDGAANLNFAVFRTDYEDLQVSSFAGTSFTVGNAAEAITQGVELDGMWRMTQGFTVRASMAFLDTEFENFETASCTAEAQAQARALGQNCVQDISGEELNFAPSVTASLGLDYRTEITSSLEFISRLDINYSDDYQIQDDQDPLDRVDSYTFLNGSIGLAGTENGWAVSLVGKNLTDEEHKTYSFDAPAQVGTHAGFMAPPRTIAIKASYSY